MAAAFRVSASSRASRGGLGSAPSKGTDEQHATDRQPGGQPREGVRNSGPYCEGDIIHAQVKWSDIVDLGETEPEGRALVRLEQTGDVEHHAVVARHEGIARHGFIE